MIVIRLLIMNTSNWLSRGVLTVPSRQIAEFVRDCFALLEYADQFIVKNHESTTRVSAEKVLGIYSQNYSFTCEKHIEKGLIFAIKIVVNIFYNNCYIIAEGFFILSFFVGYILSFILVRLRTIQLSARVGAHIEHRCSRSRGGMWQSQMS